MQPPNTTEENQLVRGLGVWGAASMVVGTVIGSGIFIVANTMTRGVGTPAMVFFVWIFGGLLSLSGALAYAEMGAMMPRSGGEYAYLRASYGPLWAFLYGWSQFLVMKTASIATLAAGFAIYFAFFVPGLNLKLVAVSIVVILGIVNYFGVRTGGAVQTFFTVLKVGLILALVFAALLVGGGSLANFGTSVPSAGLSGFVAALVAALWAYDGWNNISMAGGEVADPQRNIPRSLILGTMGVGVLYVVACASYFYILPAPDVAGAQRVASDVAQRFMGPLGAGAVALAAMVSIFAATNGSLLAGSRVPFAMAADGAFFRPLASVHPRFHSPHVAVVVQTLAAAIMALTGNYEELFTYVIFASWFYYGLTVSALFVLRRKHPDWPRPYKAWGYPVLPALFVIISAWLVVMTIREQAWWRTMIGAGIVLTGVPTFYSFRMPDQLSYTWGRIQGIAMLVGGLIPLFAFTVPQLTTTPKLIAAWITVITSLTGLTLLLKRREALWLVYLWLLLGVAMVALAFAQRAGAVPIAAALLFTAFWILCTVYYRRRRSEFR